ncbi:MAG: tetratricopeptide repeat protein [Spirochaetaceae bacterium]|jgi:tetratricopeptide (TPR) repeat protein|nr:tetratricopeptide repeat protein [Spirochaetaceae bacterium]
MKMKKEYRTGIAVILIAAAALGGLVAFQKYRSRNSLALRISELGPRGNQPQTVEELRRAIARYEERIEAHVKDAAQTGLYWKILAARLQDRDLHHEALNALERAVYYFPGDATVHYLRGLSAGVVGKSAFGLNGAGKREYLALSEASYLRAIELDPDYERPRYGLGVLYVFELDKPQEAVAHLLWFLENSRDNVDAMFVLARAYFMLENYREALDLYERIIAVARDPAQRNEAENNRQAILDSYYG